MDYLVQSPTLPPSPLRGSVGSERRKKRQHLRNPKSPPKAPSEVEADGAGYNMGDREPEADTTTESESVKRSQ